MFLKIRAESDPLTGVKNKRCIETYVMDKLRLASESGQQITVGFLDIDDFRRFNTEYGHQQADEAICYVAKTMQLWHCDRTGKRIKLSPASSYGRSGDVSC